MQTEEREERRRVARQGRRLEADAPPDPYRAYRPNVRVRSSSGFTLDRVIRIVLGVAAAAAVFWVVWYFSNLVIFLLIGVVLAYLMRPLMDRLMGVGMAKIPAILITFIGVFGLIGILLTQLVPFAGRQLSDLSQQVTFESAGRIVAVETGSVAEAAELQPGDVIVAVEGERWKGLGQLQTAVRLKEPRDTLRMVVEGADDRQVAKALVLSPPRNPGEGQGLIVEDETVRAFPRVGLSVQEVAFSDVATAIERRLREVMPIRKGAVVTSITTALDKLFQEERITQIAGSLVDIFTDIFYAVLVVPFVAFFFLKDGGQIRQSMLQLVPNRYFEITLSIIDKVEAIIGRYFRALLMQCISIAAVASVLLAVAGLKYAVAVGVFTGLANTIPYFGPLMGFLAGTLVGIVQTGDFTLVPGVLVAMALTQVADNAFFQPFIFSRAARAHPLVILFVVLIGAQLAGLVGMLVAIPLTTIVRVIVQQVLWSLRNYRILRNA